MATDVDDRDVALLEGQRKILEMINSDVELPKILEELCRTMEAQSEGMLSSVLLVSDDGTQLLHGAAPSLPSDYCEAVHGITIGDGVGSCGTAAATGEPCTVEDIATHPNWKAFRGLAYETHGLQACWSTPIKSWDGSVVATFAMYYKEPKSPQARDQKLASYSSHLVAIAVERAKERERLASLSG